MFVQKLFSSRFQSLVLGACLALAVSPVTIFSITMQGGEPFLFAGQRGNPTWMHGPEQVQFTDLPTGGIFRWGSFALVVAQ